MSKFIPPKKTAYDGQVKPKLKVKVTIKDEQHTLNEYDAFQMISDLNAKVVQLSQAVNGILDAMEAATQQVTTQTDKQPSVATLNMPKLQTIKSDMKSDHIYPNSADSVSITE